MESDRKREALAAIMPHCFDAHAELLLHGNVPNVPDVVLRQSFRWHRGLEHFALVRQGTPRSFDGKPTVHRDCRSIVWGHLELLRQTAEVTGAALQVRLLHSTETPSPQPTRLQARCTDGS